VFFLRPAAPGSSNEAEEEKEKTKKRQENNAPAPAGSRHTSTPHRRRVTRRSGGKDAAGDACDCERVSRRGAKIRGGKVRQNLRAALPTPVENPILTPPPWARPDCSKVCASRRCGIVSCQLVGRRSPRGDGRRSPACLIRGYFLRVLGERSSLALGWIALRVVGWLLLLCVWLDRDGGVARFATTTTTSTPLLFYCLRSGICFRVGVSYFRKSSRAARGAGRSRALYSSNYSPPSPPDRIRRLPAAPRPGVDSSCAAADSAAKSRLGLVCSMKA